MKKKKPNGWEVVGKWENANFSGVVSKQRVKKKKPRSSVIESLRKMRQAEWEKAQKSGSNNSKQQ